MESGPEAATPLQRWFTAARRPRRLSCSAPRRLHQTPVCPAHQPALAGYPPTASA